MAEQNPENNTSTEVKEGHLIQDYRLQTKNASFGDRELFLETPKTIPANQENDLVMRGSKSISNGVYEYLINGAETSKPNEENFSAIRFKGSRNGVIEYLPDSKQPQLPISKKPIRSIEKTRDIIGVVQNEAGQVLIGATIIAYDKGNISNGAITALNGVFELTTKGSELEIRYLGYQSIRKDIQYFLDNPVVILKENHLNLPIPIVTAQGGMLGYGCGWINKTNDPTPEINLDISFTPTKWQVYPNPTINKITVKTAFSNGIFNLISANGQILEIISIHQLQTDINLDKYPAGSYYLRYESESWTETFGPIVKVKM